MSNPVIDSLLDHRSIRRFKSDPVPEDLLDEILRVGTRAASAGNLQAYSLIVIDDPDRLEKMTFKAPLAIAALVDHYRFKRWLDLSGAPFYFDQPVNLFIAYWDAVIALQNIVVAAESLGLGTVYVGLVLSEDVQGWLGAPEYVFPAGLVFIGYPDELPPLRPRLPLEAVVHRNSYHVPSDEEVRTYYREKDKQWDGLPQAKREKLREKGIENYAQFVTLGHYTPEFIRSESDKVIENLKRAGFKLGNAT